MTKSKPFYKRRLFLIPVTLIILGLIVTSIFINRPSSTQPQLTTFTVQKQSVQKTISDSSKLEFIDLRKVGNVSGAKIVDIKVPKNTSVTNGQLIATLEVNGKNTDLTSPIDGTIVKVNYSLGEIINQTSGELFKIANLQNFKTIISVGENDINNVKVGQEAKVKIKALDTEKEYPAKVTSLDLINNTGNPSSTYSVEVTLNDKIDNAKVGMNDSVVITSDKKDNVIAISQDLIFQKGDSSYVKSVDWINKEQNLYTLKDIKITKGLENDDLSEITSGLSEGDILTSPNATQVNPRPNPFTN